MKTKHIGQIAEAVLEEVRADALTKLAELEVIQDCAAAPNYTVPAALELHKFAAEIRSGTTSVSVGDVLHFLEELRHAG